MSKITKVIEAGNKIEQGETGFTIDELMEALGWDEKEKFFVQNAVSQLTRKGRARKLSNTRPKVYSFKTGPPTSKASSPKPEQRSGADLRQALKGPQPSLPAPEKNFSFVDIAKMDIPLEVIGQAVFRHNRELERKIYELESELVEIKRKLDEANSRITEQTRMIEKQNELISGHNRDRSRKIPLVRRG